jgi:hypothetical protein
MGPLLENLKTRPASGEPVGAPLAQRLEEALAAALRGGALAPLRLLARAWSGGARLGPGPCDDLAYEELLETVAAGGAAEALVQAHPSLARMVEAGQGAYAYELELPEVFFPERAPGARRGFDAVLGNPPWESLQPLAREFFAAFDLDVLEAPTRLERTAIEQRLKADPAVRRAHETYMARLEQARRFIERCYRHVSRGAGGRGSGAVTDLWQLFAERALRLVREGGHVGLLLPSAFHANQSATGLRELYLHEAELQCCYSFENRRRIFEIDSRF